MSSGECRFKQRTTRPDTIECKIGKRASTAARSALQVSFFEAYDYLRHGRVNGERSDDLPVLDEKDKAAAIAVLHDPNIPVKEAPSRLGISVSTLYHYFPGGRPSVKGEQR